MADDRYAEAQTLKQRENPNQTTLNAIAAGESESQRLSQQADLLQGRVQMLLAQMYGSVQPQAGAAPSPRFPWQRPVWWENLQTAVSGLKLLAVSADRFSEKLGAVGQEAAHLALACASRALAAKPEDLASASMEPAQALVGLADKISPMPWHLLDVDAQSGAQLVLLLRHLVSEGMPQPDPQLQRPTRLLECQRLFTLLYDSLGDHAEAGRFEAAQQHFMDENFHGAFTILSGLAPPDALRYETNALAQLIQSIA